MLTRSAERPIEPDALRPQTVLKTPSCSLSRPVLELEVGTTKFPISGTALFCS